MADRNIRFIPKRTAVPGRIPTGTTGTESNFIKQGELALNTADHKLFSYDGVNVFEIGSTSQGNFLNLSGGTVTGNTSFAANLSATTLYSGATLVDSLFARTVHSHVIGDVTGLQTQLNGKADITGATFTGNVRVPVFTATTIYSGATLVDSLFARTVHSHAIADVTGLQTQLNNKADLTGATFTGNVRVPTFTATTLYSGATLVDSLFARTIHSHVISDVSGLQTQLNNKADLTGATFTGGIFAPSVSATTFYSGSTPLNTILSRIGYDTYITGGTFSSNTLALSNNTGGTIYVTGFTTSSGTTYTFLNGLTQLTGNVGLGGSLNQNTKITSSTYGLSIGESGNEISAFDVFGKTSLNNKYGGFNSGGVGFNFIALCSSIQSDGKILVGGQFSTFNGLPCTNGLARLNSDGTLDTSFNLSGGSGFTGTFIRATLAQPDGKILVGGGFTTYNGATTPTGIIRLNSDGTVDTSFSAGTGITSSVHSFALQSDGQILIGGQFTSYSGAPCTGGLIRVSTGGTLDLTFNSGGTGFNGNTISSIIIQPDGKFLVGGNFSQYNGVTKNNIVRINSNGSLDTTFNSGVGFLFTGSGASVSGIKVQSDGKIVVGGNFNQYNGVICPKNLVRLNVDGTLDTTFNTGGSGFVSPVSSNYGGVFIQPDGKIIFAGIFTTYNGAACPDNLARVNIDGTLDTTFNAGGAGFVGSFVGTTFIQQLSNGKLIVGGEIGSYNGVGLSNGIAQLNSDGSIDTNSNKSISFSGEGGLRYSERMHDGFTDRSIPDVAWVRNNIIPRGDYRSVQFNNNGSFSGATNVKVDGDGNLLLAGIISEPSAPLVNNLNVYAKSVAGKMLLKIKDSISASTQLQSSIYQNSIFLVTPNTSTSVTTLGGAVTSVGTLSTVTPSTTSYGLCTNFASAATTGSTAGTGQNAASLSLGSSMASCGGFFMMQRLFFPDANYGTGATGCRIFAGVTNQTMAVSVGTDDPTGHRAGFSYSTVLGDVNWNLTTKSGATETRVSTGVPFLSNKLYDFYLFANPGATSIGWRIENLTDGIISSGTVRTNLPTSTIYMRAGFQISTLGVVARNVRMKKLYVETDN